MINLIFKLILIYNYNSSLTKRVICYNLIMSVVVEAMY